MFDFKKVRDISQEIVLEDDPVKIDPCSRVEGTYFDGLIYALVRWALNNPSGRQCGKTSDHQCSGLAVLFRNLASNHHYRHAELTGSRKFLREAEKKELCSGSATAVLLGMICVTSPQERRRRCIGLRLRP